jgi:hypothetical protein
MIPRGFLWVLRMLLLCLRDIRFAQKPRRGSMFIDDQPASNQTPKGLYVNRLFQTHNPFGVQKTICSLLIG